MPTLPVLDNKPAGGGLGSSSAGEVAQQNTPFKLSELDLGSIGMTMKRPSGEKRKRGGGAAVAPLDDDEDPREEAQVQVIRFFEVTNTTVAIS